jgi:hypothetical protein
MKEISWIATSLERQHISCMPIFSSAYIMLHCQVTVVVNGKEIFLSSRCSGLDPFAIKMIYYCHTAGILKLPVLLRLS